MSISFQCSHCSKKLKAPDSAAGKSSPCPRCGNMVTCPEPVYDAEIVVTKSGRSQVDMSRPEIDPYADLDDGAPYAMANQEASDEEGNVSGDRRPCPMCGEMIVATAAKCRFCGEVFDTAIRKVKSRKKKKSRGSGGGSNDGLRELIGGLACFGIGTALTVGGYMNAAANARGGRYFIFYGLIIGGAVGAVQGAINLANSRR